MDGSMLLPQAPVRCFYPIVPNTWVRLKELLSKDLGFHGENSSEMTHDFHAFPAKFPPQLPRIFIKKLTQPGEKVLDPMMGSGTCIVEAILSGRIGVGFDIDPLAVMISKVKTNQINPDSAQDIGLEIADIAEHSLNKNEYFLESELIQRFNINTKKFIDYWFSYKTQLELLSLLIEIEKVIDLQIKDFLKMVFSAIIITKSGGVSLAWDLAHTRPHKLNRGVPKSYKCVFSEFRKKLIKNISRSKLMAPNNTGVLISYATAENMPLKDNSIDLLFTSPPYASNAIDYMRAHKFSLVWFGKSIDELSNFRKNYIGGDNTSNFQFQEMPNNTKQIISKIKQVDEKKGMVLHRYFTEMKKVIFEAFRVLKPGKAAIFVVGSSTMRGIDSQTPYCIGEIGSFIGFDLVGITMRKLDRNKRMLPARSNDSPNSQIEERMHEEYVVALIKPMEENDGNH
jgi:DNA modification methylase